MKRSLIVAALTLVAAIAALTVITRNLNATATTTTFIPVAERGDRSAAQGLTLHTGLTVGGYLRWNTEYMPDTAESGTVFSFQSGGWQGGDLNEISSYYPYYSSELYIVPCYLTDTINLEELLHVDGTETEVEKIIRLKDYYDVHPLFLSVSQSYMESQTIRHNDPSSRPTEFRFDKLQIPVDDDDTMVLHIRKHFYSENSAYDYECSVLDIDTVMIPFSVPMKGCLLATVGFLPDVEAEESWAPEGFGLWEIPVTQQSMEFDRASYVYDAPDMAQARLAYPLDITRQNVVALAPSADLSQYLLLVAEDGQLVLHVLDAATYQCLQTLPLGEAKAEPYDITQYSWSGTEYTSHHTTYGTMAIHRGDNFLAISLNEERMAVLLPDGDGYRLDFICPVLRIGQMTRGDSRDQYLWSDEYDRDDPASPVFNEYTPLVGIDSFTQTPMCYHDGKLAMAFYGPNYSSPCTVVEVYGPDGLTYGACITSDLARQYYGHSALFTTSFRPKLTWE